MGALQVEQYLFHVYSKNALGEYNLLTCYIIFPYKMLPPPNDITSHFVLYSAIDCLNALQVTLHTDIGLNNRGSILQNKMAIEFKTWLGLMKNDMYQGE